jgi:hypothetical protein
LGEIKEHQFEPSSAPSLVKLEKQFCQCSLKKGQDPDIWITELGDMDDISLIKERSFGGAKFWTLIVDDCTDYC